MTSSSTQKINIILPIVLALLLPGLSFYAYQRVAFPNNAISYPIWALTSLFLYHLWYLLWNLWDFNREYANWKYRIKLAYFLTFSIGVIALSTVLNLQDFDFYYLIRTSFGVSLFLTIQFALKTQENIAQLRIEKEQIQKENFKEQLKVLHAKIDPHFLFNSLNTLRSMVRQAHGNSEEFVLSLADFYRQTLKYNENIKLSLSEELKVLKSYLFLMKNRNEEAVFVNIDIDKSLFDLFLPTLALQIVVENCFKHNSMTSLTPLRIDISNSDNGYIEVRNNIQPKIGSVESTGNGLDLLIKRYDLMNISEGVIVEKSSNQFSVKLKLIN